MRGEIDGACDLISKCEAVPAVNATPGQLGQVFSSLISNALHAICEDDGPQRSLRISTGCDDRGRVVVEIFDTGCGMSQEILRRIFTPFFTTRQEGRGAGLSLSICHKVVESLNGEIEVESIPNEGSRVRVILPASANARA